MLRGSSTEPFAGCGYKIFPRGQKYDGGQLWVAQPGVKKISPSSAAVIGWTADNTKTKNKKNTRSIESGLLTIQHDVVLQRHVQQSPRGTEKG